MLHRDRVRVRVLRYDRKGRPEGRVLDIVERRKAPIIGRLLHEGGIWLVAPEDRRYGQDIMVPKNAIANAAVGQVVSIELTEPPSLYSQPMGRVTEVLGEIDDPGMEIEIAVRKYEVPHRFSPETLAQAAALPDKLRARRPAAPHRPHATCRWSPSTARTRATSTTRCTASPSSAAAARRAFEGWRLIVAIADVSHYVKPGEPIDERRLRARHLGVLSAPRDPDAAREAVQRPVLAEPERGPAGDGVRHGRRHRRRDRRLPVLPGGDPLARAADLHRGGRGAGQHARPRGRSAAPTWCRTCCTCTRSTARCSSSVRSAARSTSRPPRRRSSATTTAASRRSCRARATRRTG